MAKPPEEGPVGEMAEEADRCRGSLREYIRAAWHVLEPGKRFVPNWHIDAISDHLSAVSSGDVKRLIINIPPGTMKSLTVSVFWMTWEWVSNPVARWLFLTHDIDLCSRDARRCRDLILSPWYQERWGHVYQLAPDQAAKLDFANTRRGSRVAKTMTGARGHGGERIVIDDPHNTRVVESEVMRKTTIRAWDEEISTRLRDQRSGAYVVMMQRLHQADLTGHILEIAEPGHWEHLMLPMRFDPARRCRTRLFEDPRTDAGEWLWPEFIPPDSAAVREQERFLGPYGVAGQWQQEPYARSGGQFERAWFKPMDSIPGTWKMIWVRYWDQAGTEGGGKYTAGVLMGYCIQLGVVVIADVVRGQWGAGNRYQQIKLAAEMDALRFGVPANGAPAQANKLAVLNVVEQEPGSGGKDSAQETLRYLRGYRADAEPASGDKFIRADPFAGAAKNGDVYVLVKPWTEAYLAEMEVAGPGAKYLDQMDASSGAYNRLMKLKDQRVRTSGKGIDMRALDDEGFTQAPGWIV